MRFDDLLVIGDVETDHLIPGNHAVNPLNFRLQHLLGEQALLNVLDAEAQVAVVGDPVAVLIDVVAIIVGTGRWTGPASRYHWTSCGARSRARVLRACGP